MSDDDFLSRWSRRKRAVAEDEAPPVALPENPVDAREPETPEEEQALLTRLKLPVPESLQPGDDFSAFMADGVPQFLRKRALRVLWRSNPVLANLDGLNDYDDDFRSPELTQKVLATAYQVGRGIVSKVVESDTEQAKTVTDDEPDEDAIVIEEPSEIAGEIPRQQSAMVHNEEPEQIARPRRMRFKT
ncbi:MAG: DUF3306 domain-containing protein [Paracoccaceae bacterium]